VLVVVCAFVVMGIQSRGGAAPGMAEARLKPCGAQPNCVSSGATTGSQHHVAPFRIQPDQANVAWADLVEVIAVAGGEVQENAPPYLAATFRSRVFGFVDDLECLIDRDAGLIHVRSAARVGYSDMNVNRARVERLRAMLAARLAP
jgi:uncharacterized protein (DUF1499 family)